MSAGGPTAAGIGTHTAKIGEARPLRFVTIVLCRTPTPHQPPMTGGDAPPPPRVYIYLMDRGRCVMDTESAVLDGVVRAAVEDPNCFWGRHSQSSWWLLSARSFGNPSQGFPLSLSL
jgi:hypothetical protein